MNTLCLNTLECGVDELPINFTAHQLTEAKDKGNLRYAKWNVFKLLSVVETAVLRLCDSQKIFEQNSFIDMLHSICADALPQVGCDSHKEEVMVNMMYDYSITRYKCVAKHHQRAQIELKRTKTHSKRKEGKV